VGRNAFKNRKCFVLTVHLMNITSAEREDKRQGLYFSTASADIICYEWLIIPTAMQPLPYLTAHQEIVQPEHNVTIHFQTENPEQR
jgi:hypothetical protein